MTRARAGAATGRRRAGAAALVGLVALTLAACGSTDEPAELGEQPVDRVLVFSLPGVAWEDVRRYDMPNLEAFIEDAAIGDISTRIGRSAARLTDAYLSMGAGTRAIAPEIDVAVALEPDEPYGGVPASEILRRRLGFMPNGIGYLPIGNAIDRNDDSPYGADVGLLGQQLAEAGIARAVVANADAGEGFVSEDPPPDGAYARSAATMLMGDDGVVPDGKVSRGLLADDPNAPFGRRLDHEAVLGALDMEWNTTGRAVVLVEASDISRAAAYRPRATPSQARDLRAQAIIDADVLLGEVLARTDPDRDAVLVVSPVAPAGSPALALVGLRAPGVEPGLLQSATTRRDGYVHLADVAPTILTLLGEEPPDDIEGRSFQVGGGATDGRVDRLVDETDAAGFRDAMVPLLVTLISTWTAVLVLATWQRHRLGRRAPEVLAAAAFVALGVVPATFLMGRFGFTDGQAVPYLAVLLGIAAAFGGVAYLVDRARPGLGALVAVGTIVVLVGADVLLGAPLQLNTVFGYSVAVAGRFTGLGNLAFAVFGSATIVLAALIVDRHGRAGLRAAFALLAGVIVVEGLPMLGADVGGVVAMVPAFGVTALLLADRRVTGRVFVLLVGVSGAVLLAFAFVDAARPAGSQTHLARLAQHLVAGRFGAFTDTLTRRWTASFGGAETAAWGLVWTLLAGSALYVTLVAFGRAGPEAPRRTGPWVAAAGGLAVLSTVGLVANDSSVAVPATMLIVVVPVIVLQVLRAAPGGIHWTNPEPAPERGRAPSPAGTGSTSSTLTRVGAT
ncbi:MAG TPA: hypothetical protein VIL36_09885 [Acidimicrobiales bacterium]